MEHYKTINEYADLFDALTNKALVEGLKVTEDNARTMRSRRRIPSGYWPKLVRIPEAKALGVTPEILGRCEFELRHRQERAETEPELPMPPSVPKPSEVRP